jgi:AcrR family transcriptional regulator
VSSTGEASRTPRSSDGFSAPLYPKLRPGRHRIPADEIEAIQRERLQGAVIHAVANGGYQATSTRELCRLAGVSMRTLYERYGSKEACLQATYDAVLEPIVTSMRQAHSSQREPQARLHAVIEAFHRAVARERCGKTLALLIAAEAAESDLGGPMRLVDYLGELLNACFEGGGPPDFVLRGAAAAVMSVTRSWIFRGREDELGELAGQLSAWVDQYRGQATQLLGKGRSELLTQAAQEPHALGAEGKQAPDAAQSLQQSSERALGLMARKGASDRDWAVGLCLAYSELLAHVRSDPRSARVAFVDAPGLGPDADCMREQMIQAAVDLYIKRAPSARTPSPAVAHAVVGASWGLLHDHLEGRDSDPDTTILCEQLSYLASAPVLGCKQAVASILTRRSATRRPIGGPGRFAAGARIRTGAGASMATW